MTHHGRIVPTEADFAAFPSWPLRLAAFRDTPFLAACLESIRDDAARAGDAGVRVMTGDFQDDLPWSKIRAVRVLTMGRDGRWIEGPRRERAWVHHSENVA